MRRRQRVAAGFGSIAFDFQETGDRLLLKPLARVALVDTGRGCQFAGVKQTPIGQHPIQPKALAQVNVEQLQRADQCIEHPPNEGVALLFVSRHVSRQIPFPSVLGDCVLAQFLVVSLPDGFVPVVVPSIAEPKPACRANSSR
jgi:hypothetical protein